VRAEGDEQMATIQELEFAIEQMENIEVNEGNEEVYQRTLEKKIAEIRRRHNGKHTNCHMCGVHKICLYTSSNCWTCEVCIRSETLNSGRIQCNTCNHQRDGKVGTARTNSGICYVCIPKYIPSTSDVPASLKKLKSQLTRKKKDYRKAVAKSQPYIEAGLGPAFALAIAKGTPDEEVMDLWEADWWKQYDDEDMLIVAVLDGTLTEEQGRYLNGIRSDHERLALTCVENPDMIAWADALLECGFNKVPDAVNNVLDGGQPHIVARIRKMKIDAEITPEPLKKPVLLQNPPEHMLEKEDSDNEEKEDSDDEDQNPIEEEYQEHVAEMADDLED
jgi:hypothetical protein